MPTTIYTTPSAPYYGLEPSRFVRQLSYESQVNIWHRLLEVLNADMARVAMRSRVADLADTISLDGVAID